MGPATDKALSVLLQTVSVTGHVVGTPMPKNKAPVYSFALKKGAYSEAAFVKKTSIIIAFLVIHSFLSS